MRKFIRFADGVTVELSPLSYHEFMALDLWSGGSDTAYAAWLRKNGYVEVSDYCEEALADATFSIELTPVSNDQLLFDPEGDGNWRNFIMLAVPKPMSENPCLKLIPRDL